MLQITPVNHDLEKDGNWVTYHGVELKIARSNSQSFKTALAKAMKPYKRQLQRQELFANNELELATCKALANHILVDWRGFSDGNGGEVPYSSENAYGLLTHDEDCRSFVFDYASEASNYFEEEIEDTVKKS